MLSAGLRDYFSLHTEINSNMQQKQSCINSFCYNLFLQCTILVCQLFIQSYDELLACIQSCTQDNDHDGDNDD